MEIQKHYANLVERQKVIQETEPQGLWIKCDEFDADWVVDTEPHGTLTFTNVEVPSVFPIPRDFGVEIDTLKAEVAIIKERLKLK